MQAWRRRVDDGGPIELVFEPGDEAVVGGLVGAARVRGRHHASAKLPHHELPFVGMLADPCRLEIVERQLAGRILTRRLGALTVASDAIAIEQGALRRARSGRGWRL